MEGEWKLEKEGAESLRITEHVETNTDGFFVFHGGAKFMGKSLPKFSGKEKTRVGGHIFEPLAAIIRFEGIIEASVDLDRVEKFGNVSRFCEIAGSAFWVKDTFPIWIGPAGKAKMKIGGLGSFRRRHT